MTDPITPEWLDELEAAAKAATPGPWERDRYYDGDAEYGSGPNTSTGFDASQLLDAQGRAIAYSAYDPAEVHEEYDEDGVHAWDDVALRNFNFIAAANPEAVLRLITEHRAALAEVERLRSISGEARNAALAKLQDDPDPMLARMNRGQVIAELKAAQNWNDERASMADGFDMPESAKHHDAQRRDFKAMVEALRTPSVAPDLVGVLKLLVGSVDAAYAEGLDFRLAEAKGQDGLVGELHDLLTRRILWHVDDARAALAKLEPNHDHT